MWFAAVAHVHGRRCSLQPRPAWALMRLEREVVVNLGGRECDFRQFFLSCWVDVRLLHIFLDLVCKIHGGIVVGLDYSRLRTRIG